MFAWYNREVKRSQSKFIVAEEFAKGTRLADVIFAKFKIDKLTSEIDKWENNMARFFTKLCENRINANKLDINNINGLSCHSESDNIKEWSDAFYQLYMLCQKGKTAETPGSFDRSGEFNEFMEIWRISIIQRIMDINEFKESSTYKSTTYGSSTQNSNMNKPNANKSIIAESDIDDFRKYPKTADVIVGSHITTAYTSKIPNRSLNNLGFNCTSPIGSPLFTATELEAIASYKQTQHKSPIKQGSVIKPETSKNGNQGFKALTSYPVIQSIPQVKHQGGAMSLKDSLNKSMNLSKNPAVVVGLSILERKLIDFIKAGSSKIDIVNNVRTFCRSNSGQGYYDQNNMMVKITEEWYNSIVDIYDLKHIVNDDQTKSKPKIAITKQEHKPKVEHKEKQQKEEHKNKEVLKNDETQEYNFSMYQDSQIGIQRKFINRNFLIVSQ